VKISKIILAIQSVILIYFSLFGFIFAFGLVIPLLTGASEFLHLIEFIFGLTLFVFLISGWRVYFWVLLNGPKKGKRISNIWLVFCGFALTCIFLTCLLNAYMEGGSFENPLLSSTQLFVFGLFFVPTAIHVCLEWFWQSKSTTKS